VRRLLPDSAALDDDAALAEAYAFPPGRSMRVNFVASLDGVVAVEGRSAGLGSPGDLRIFRMLRALADVVVVGYGTAAAEGYGPVAPDSRVARLRAELGRPAELPIAVVSRRASLVRDDRLAVPPTIVITCASSDADRRAALTEAGVTVLVCGDDDVDLPAALETLAERGLARATCEGGPQLLRSALAAGVVDELDLTVTPALAGTGTRLAGDAALPQLAWFRPAQLLEEGGVLFARYLPGDPISRDSAG
jgi:riboflavin biosynthesis pyrimidine reductase